MWTKACIPLWLDRAAPSLRQLYGTVANLLLISALSKLCPSHSWDQAFRWPSDAYEACVGPCLHSWLSRDHACCADGAFKAGDRVPHRRCHVPDKHCRLGEWEKMPK